MVEHGALEGAEFLIELISILTAVDQLIGNGRLTDYEQVDDLVVLANGWLTVGDRNRAKQLLYRGVQLC